MCGVKKLALGIFFGMLKSVGRAAAAAETAAETDQKQSPGYPVWLKKSTKLDRTFLPLCLAMRDLQCVSTDRAFVKMVEDIDLDYRGVYVFSRPNVN